MQRQSQASAVAVIVWRIDPALFTSSNILHRRRRSIAVRIASLSHRHRRRSAWCNSLPPPALLLFQEYWLLFVVFVAQAWIYGHRQADRGAWPCQLQKPRSALSIPSSLNFANEVSQRTCSVCYKSRSAQKILFQTNGDWRLSCLYKI